MDSLNHQAITVDSASENRFKSAFEYAAVSMSIVSLDCRFMEINQADCDLFGYTHEEMLNLTVADISYPDDADATRELTLRMLAGEINSFQLQKRYRHKQGHIFWGLLSMTLVRDATGQPLYYIAVIQEISEHKKVEVALRESEERYRAFVEQSSEAIWRFEADPPIPINQSEDEVIEQFYQNGYLAECNDALARMYGLTKAREMEGARLSDFLVRSDPGNIHYLRAFIRSGYHLKDAESHEVDKDGHTKYFLNNLIGIVESGALVRAWGTQRDITENKRASEVMSQLAAIVESSNDAIIGKDLNGIITSWNRGAQRLYGYTAEEVIGRSISLLTPPERPNEIPEILNRLKQGERVQHYETVRIRKDGCPVDISLTVSPIKDATGKTVGASAIARDITERKRMEATRAELLIREQQARAQAEEAKAQAEAARTEAEAVNRAKDEFLATLSHELRTPLNAILGWARLLGSGQLDEQTQANAIETIERNAQLQARLIEDLLDVSRIINGKLKLKVENVELASIVEASVAAVQLAADAKAIRLESVLDSDVGPVLGDSARLQQVLWNLLSNAIKFTPREGHVQIRLAREGTYANVAITDNGRGIKPEFLPYVFDRFKQADSSSTRNQGGLGLGLAIVRHLVELQGGTVHAASRGEGLGATFSVRLPLINIEA